MGFLSLVVWGKRCKKGLINQSCPEKYPVCGVCRFLLVRVTSTVPTTNHPLVNVGCPQPSFAWTEPFLPLPVPQRSKKSSSQSALGTKNCDKKFSRVLPSLLLKGSACCPMRIKWSTIGCFPSFCPKLQQSLTEEERLQNRHNKNHDLSVLAVVVR